MIKVLSKIADKFRYKYRSAAHGLPDNDDPLREFIYLDEVSLISLIAAKGGAIAEEIKANNQSLIEGGVSGTIGYEATVGSNLIGSTKGSLGTSVDLKTSSTQGIETTFKLVAQSRFKQFMASENIKSSVISGAKFSQDSNPLDADKGLRGKLFELDVIPQPTQLFSVSLVMDEIIKMADKAPGQLEQLIPAASSQQLLFGISMLKLLYAGLIPLEASVKGLSILTKDGTNRIVKTPEVINSEPVDDKVSNLKITALASQQNFWTDIRRALYTGKEFKVLVRAIGDCIESNPRSLPLIDVLKSISGNTFGELSNNLDKLSSLNLGSMANLDQEGAQLYRNALCTYGNKILAYAKRKTTSRISALEKFVNSLSIDDLDISSQVAYFNAVSEFLKEKFDISTKEELKAKYRSEARAEAGLSLIEERPTTQKSQMARDDHETKTDYYLDVELVAMYW